MIQNHLLQLLRVVACSALKRRYRAALDVGPAPEVIAETAMALSPRR
ncbi:hypothetical protein [Streptomyces sp. NPDC057623]